MNDLTPHLENRRKIKKGESSILLDKKLLDKICGCCSSAYPEECCGLLIGEFQDGSVLKKVISARATNNVFQKKERYHRYTVDPMEYLAVETEAERLGQEVVGIYHSHPDAPPRPSRFDQSFAWPELSYVIIETKEGKPTDVKSWRLKEDGSTFFEEKLIIKN